MVAAFVRATIGEAAWPVDDQARGDLLGRARMAQVLGLLALGLLVYSSVLLARGRVQALLACACLVLLPAVSLEGHVLRPEMPAAVLAGFAVLLLQCLSHAPRDGRVLGAPTHWLRLAALAACVMVANSLAVAALPTGGEVLLVPGIVLTLAALQTGTRALRILRRRSVLRLPLRAINRRLLPWTAMALLSPVVALWLLPHAIVGSTEALAATMGMQQLLPGPLPVQIAVATLWLLGAVVATVRVGMHFGRRGRLGPDLVLFVACAVALAASCADAAGQDRLPAAAAMAVLCSEGARVAFVLLRGRVSR